jgi:hypothetical protein
MLFRVLASYPLTKTQFFTFSIQNAKQKIVGFRMVATEIKLEELLMQRYGLGLKPMCFMLLNKLKVSQVADTELIFTFIDDDADKLARLITYGNGVIDGSPILTQALVRKPKGAQ